MPIEHPQSEHPATPRSSSRALPTLAEMARDNLNHRDCRGELCDPSGCDFRAYAWAPHVSEMSRTKLWNGMYASDLFSPPAVYLKALRANGWPWAEWVWFSATNPRIAIIGRTIAGEESLEAVDRWRVEDLLQPDRQLDLPGIE